MSSLRSLLLSLFSVALLSSCQQGLQKDEGPRGRFVPMKDLVKDAPPGSDLVLRASSLIAGPMPVMSGASTTATMSEALDRIEIALEDKVTRRSPNPNTLEYQLAIAQARASLLASRDPADLSSGAVFALGQLIMGACGSLTPAQLAAYGINTSGTVDSNAAALKAFGLRLFSNSSLITASTAPALYAQAGTIFDAQVGKLRTATYPTGLRFPTQAAVISVCFAAIQAGAFRTGT